MLKGTVGKSKRNIAGELVDILSRIEQKPENLNNCRSSRQEESSPEQQKAKKIILGVAAIIGIL